MTDSKTPRVVYVSHDVEKTGSFLIRNPINSVGFYVGYKDTGEEIFKRKFNIKVKQPTFDSSSPSSSVDCPFVGLKVLDYGDYEPRCWEEFWSKQPKSIHDATIENAREPEEAWKEISEFVDDLEVKFPEKKYKIQFVSDNPSFDTASISLLKSTRIGRR